MATCGTSWHTNVRGSSQIHLRPNCQLKERISVLDNGGGDKFVGKTCTDVLIFYLSGFGVSWHLLGDSLFW